MLTVCATVLLVVGIVWLAYLARVTLTLILAAGVFAIALSRVGDFLRRRGVRRGLSRAIVLAGFFAVLIGVALLIIPSAVHQARQFIEQAPEIGKRIEASSWFEKLDERFGIKQQIEQVRSHVGSLAGGALDPAIKALGGIVTGLAAAATFLFVMIFLVIYAEDVIHRILSEVVARRRARYQRLLENLYRAVGGYLTGLMALCGINATLSTTWLAIIGMPYFLPMGILAGASSMIPYIGPAVVGTLVTLAVIATGGLAKGIATAIYFTAYGQIEGNILSPFIFKRTVHVNPLVTLLSVLIAADILGVPGAILAVPIAACVQIVLLELLRMRRRRLDLPLTGDVASAGQDEGVEAH